MNKQKIFLAALGAATLFALPGTTAAVDTSDDDFVPLSKMKPLERTEGYVNKHGYQFGMTAANTLINRKGIWVEDRPTYISDLRRGLFIGNYRPFFRYIRDEKHTFNVRGRFEYRYNPSLPDDPKLRGGEVVSNGTYNLEMLNAELDFDEHKVTAGRAFYRMGRGLLFANFADGAEYTGNFRFFQVKALAAYSGEYGGCTISISGCRTNADSDIKAKATFDIIPGRPIDANVPDPGRRFFVGAEVQSAQLYGSNLYLLGLYSRDMTRDAAAAGTNAGKIFAFDPLYFGAGLQGFIATPRLRYLAEGIAQRGQTYAKSTGSGSSLVNRQIDINALAVTADLNYSLPVVEKLLKPGISLQYAHATGRDSTTPNPANPSQEATGGTDYNFYAFGVYSAGLALQPRLNNLHVIRLGAQFRPLHHYYWGRNLMVSAKYTIYRKANADYGISDNTATEKKAGVGSGIDLQAVWDLRSDLKIFYAYGYFSPGEAYPSKDAKSFHSHIISVNALF
jgi:hypothetical protein